jgi:serine O-acetyltransferase
MNNDERRRHLDDLAARVAATYRRDGVINRIGEKDLPSRSVIVGVLEDLLAVVFPGYHSEPVPRDGDLAAFAAGHLQRIADSLDDVLARTLRFSSRHGVTCAALWSDRDTGADAPPTVTEADIAAVAGRLTLEYLDHLPEIRGLLRDDIQAAFDGDPAAQGHDEVVLCYPGVHAIAVHRLAHPLYLMGVPLVPRIMNEWAHHRAGVDIHPGARIGRSFFIDHGTGVVIGETTVIGDRVKIYQGVTLGALSFRRHEDGTVVKGGRRHPRVEDDVTIYAGATILGGDTVIGRGAVIGGGAWITRPVPPGAKVRGGHQSPPLAPPGSDVVA